MADDEFKERVGVGRPSNIGRRVGGPGQTVTTGVLRDDGPGVAGCRTEHWSGRVDATVVNPKTTILAPIKQKEPKR